MEYAGPKLLLFLSYAVLFSFPLIFGYMFWNQLRVKSIPNNAQGLEYLVKNFMPKELQEEVSKNKRSFGALFIDGKFRGIGTAITSDRVLVKGLELKTLIQNTLSRNKKVEIRFLDNSLTYITKFITSNDSVNVQMAVFQIDQPIGSPGKLHEQNLELLRKMKAFN